MSGLLAILLSNLLVALVLGVLALLAGQWSRRPALAHGLWVLFFVKLLTPPLVTFPIPWSIPTPPEAQVRQRMVAEAPFDAVNRGPDVLVEEPAVRGVDGAAINQEPLAANADLPWPPAGAPVFNGQQILPAGNPNHAPPPDEASVFAWAEVCTGLWLAGSFCWFSLAVARLLRFRRQLRFAQPAPAGLQKEARDLARQLEVACPGVWILPGPLSPMLWVLGWTPRLLIPAGLLERLDVTQQRALLLHELAHWRRRDHWVRRLELAVLGLYWWCPLVWWARRQMQVAEEECCDAWVVWMMPGAARGYALALVETVDFLAGARTALPPVACGIGHMRLLKRRLTMIMRGTTPRTLTLGGGLAVLGLGALLLPLMPSWAQSPRAADPTDTKRSDPFADPAGAKRSNSFQDRDNRKEPEAARQDDKQEPQAAQQDDKRFPAEALIKAQQDIHRMQIDLERARQDLERRATELHQMMDRFKKAASEAALQGDKIPARGSAANEAKDRGKTPEFGQGLRADGILRGPAGDMDKRLREVERKLDLLIEMMSRKGPSAPRPDIQPPGGTRRGGSGTTPPTPQRENQPNQPPDPRRQEQNLNPPAAP